VNINDELTEKDVEDLREKYENMVRLVIETATRHLK